MKRGRKDADTGTRKEAVTTAIIGQGLKVKRRPIRTGSLRFGLMAGAFGNI